MYTNSVFDIAEVSVGQHFYWQLGPYQVHGQVLITTWIVLGIIAAVSFLGNSNLNQNDDFFPIAINEQQPS